MVGDFVWLVKSAIQTIVAVVSYTLPAAVP